MRRKRFYICCLLIVMLISIICPLPVAADTVDVKAAAYVLMDADSGQVLLAKDEHKQLPPASMTKLMTLILATEDLEQGKAGLKDTVASSENASKMGGSQVFLAPGEQMTFEDMLISIAVGSANDACVAVAEHLDGSHQNFVDRMNEKAKQMGLKDTYFVNAYGLPAEGHLTSAYDMAVMARYALSMPKLMEYTSIKEYSLRQGKFILYNTNKLLWWYQGADGFKTGWTDEAKYCLTSTAKRDGLRLIAVVMGSPEKNGHFKDSMQLLNYGFARYAFKSFYPAGSTCGVVTVGKGVADSVEAVTPGEAGTIILKGEDKKTDSQKILSPYVNAPVQEGQKLGEIQIFKDGKLQKSVNLVAAKSVGRGGLFKEILKILGETFLL